MKKTIEMYDEKRIKREKRKKEKENDERTQLKAEWHVRRRNVNKIETHQSRMST